MAGVLGVVGDSLSIYSFISSLFAAQGNNIATVRVAAALNGNGLSAADGGIEAVRLYNSNQQLIGSRGGSYIGSGGFHDFVITQPNSQQATYAQIGATNDAICIPYVTSTWVDGSRYGWSGDWGYVCNLNWYYGNVFVDNGQNKPRCTWLDNDHSNNFKAGMLFINFPSFTDKKVHGTNKQNYCKYPALRAYSQNNGGSQIFKRDDNEGGIEEEEEDDDNQAIYQTSVEKAKRNTDSRLVISSDPTHNATALCQSQTSLGPDFVSLFEQVYCNMETRETLPLCADGVHAECFSMEAKSKQKRDGTESRKEFTSVITWE